MRCSLAIANFTLLLAVSGCEYGDSHGSAANSDLTLGLKEKPKELYAYRHGSIDFTGFFVFSFPQSSQSFFNSPPSEFFEHPKPLSYERGHTFVTWQQTPVEEAHHFLKQWAADIIESHKIEIRWKKEFNSALNASHCYYAVRYEEIRHGLYDNITFYVVDPTNRRLYEIGDTSSHTTEQAEQDTAGQSATAE